MAHPVHIVVMSSQQSPKLKPESQSRFIALAIALGIIAAVFLLVIYGVTGCWCYSKEKTYEQQQWLKGKVKESQKEEPRQKLKEQKPSPPSPEPPIQLQQQSPAMYQPLFPDLNNVLAEMEVILTTIDTELDNVHRYLFSFFFVFFIISFIH